MRSRANSPIVPSEHVLNIPFNSRGCDGCKDCLAALIWKRAAVAHKPGTPPTVLRHTMNMATMDDVVKSSLLFLCLFSLLLQPGSTGNLRLKRQDETASK